MLLVGMPVAAATSALDLTVQERAWLDSHPEIRVAPDPAFPPFEYFDAVGVYRGIAADYLARFEKRLGVKFTIVHKPNWDAVLTDAQARQIDMLAAIARSPQREQYLLFTESHIRAPGVIISANDYQNLDELIGKKVAVVSGYVWDDLIAVRKPDIRAIRVPDIQTGLEMTSLRAVDAMIGDLATTTHYIRENSITNLSIVGRLDQQLELSLATRNDWPELRAILEKALASISPAEKEAITERWIRIREPSLLQNETFRKVALAVLGGVALVLTLVLVWNRTLKLQVEQRTQQLRDAQMQLIQAAKLESVGRLAAGVAHEVKNPLAVVQLGVEYLQGDANADEVSREVMHDMADAVRRADTVIKGLLDFSRESKLNIHAASINDVVTSALRLVNHELTQRNVRLDQKLAGDLPTLELDPDKLQQVFINLFMNAAQAMERDGALLVETASKTLDASDISRDHPEGLVPGTTVVTVEVADTGPGIAETELDKIFDPFFTTKPVGEGTGLGLSVTQKIVQLHKGAIAIRNRAQGGLSVMMMFPINQGASTS
ncbi:MAG: transporter substrate-binding domain-containing protein [Pseudomonadota bacterium]|nr:MAG: transporter substrate-binding domain-containing protein [Pseudomonadota bacterium]